MSPFGVVKDGDYSDRLPPHTLLMAAYRRFLKEAESGDNMSMDNTFGLGPTPVVAKKKGEVPVASAPSGEAPIDSSLATMKVEPSTLDPSAGRKPKHVSLVCLDGWEIGKEVALGGNEEHILGRSRGANTCLDSQLVSREHAKIECNSEYGAEHFVLTDLGSSNGTYVNNVPITSTSLHYGDKILMGDILFKFLIQGEVEHMLWRRICGAVSRRMCLSIRKSRFR